VVFSIEMWRTSVEVCELSGHPSTGHTGKNMKKVHKIVNGNSRSKILEFAGRLGLSHGTCQGILRVLQTTAVSVPQ
jgi:hypothetical protein